MAPFWFVTNDRESVLYILITQRRQDSNLLLVPHSLFRISVAAVTVLNSLPTLFHIHERDLKATFAHALIHSTVAVALHGYIHSTEPLTFTPAPFITSRPPSASSASSVPAPPLLFPAAARAVSFAQAPLSCFPTSSAAHRRPHSRPHPPRYPHPHHYHPQSPRLRRPCRPAVRRRPPRAGPRQSVRRPPASFGSASARRSRSCRGGARRLAPTDPPQRPRSRRCCGSRCCGAPRAPLRTGGPRPASTCGPPARPPPIAGLTPPRARRTTTPPPPTTQRAPAGTCARGA